MSRPRETIAALRGDLQRALLRRAREWACTLVALMQKRPVLAGTLLVACGYGLMHLGWDDTAEAVLVYCLVAYVLATFSRNNGRALWLLRAWNLVFVVDLGIKAFLIAVYKSRPDAAQVIEGISNTNSDESTEFLMNYWMLLGTFTLQLSVLAALLIVATRPVQAATHTPSGRKGLAAVAVLFALLHLNPTVRRANPLVFWPAQAATIEEFRANVETLPYKREIAFASLGDWQPTYIGPERHTLGLVIGESTNRWDWQLYGYVRPTTPELARQAAKNDGLMVFRDVLSAASSTVSSLRQMLTPLSLHQRLSDEEQPSVLMLAKAAGYKVFWISNQHDRYITARFADEADVEQLLNKGGVGDDRSLDERILPEWKRALDDPAPRKLIIAHLMGAHAHYGLRSPDRFKHFEGHTDGVDLALEAQGRPPWVRLKRDQYDDAMLYQDWVISRLLTQFKKSVGGQSASWLYTSDHAEEVGHTRDFTGHSPDEPGQVVPLLMWNSMQTASTTSAAIENRPFQTDVLDWTLLDLMHVRTRHDQPQDLLLADNFQPRERRLHDGSEYHASR